MKKALNITSLVFGILGVLSVIAFLILGTVFLVSADPLARAIVDQAIQADSTVDAEALYASTLVVFSTCGTAFVVMGAIGIAGTALWTRKAACLFPQNSFLRKTRFFMSLEDLTDAYRFIEKRLSKDSWKGFKPWITETRNKGHMFALQRVRSTK